MKRMDVEQSNENKVTIAFDLQAILYVPHAGDSQIYYKRKLAIYNFTIFDHQHNGFCYMWDESNGSKRCNEINSHLISYLWALPFNVTEVTTWSDTCSGQN